MDITGINPRVNSAVIRVTRAPFDPHICDGIPDENDRRGINRAQREISFLSRRMDLSPRRRDRDTNRNFIN